MFRNFQHLVEPCLFMFMNQKNTVVKLMDGQESEVSRYSLISKCKPSSYLSFKGWECICPNKWNCVCVMRYQDYFTNRNLKNLGNVFKISNSEINFLKKNWGHNKSNSPTDLSLTLKNQSNITKTKSNVEYYDNNPRSGMSKIKTPSQMFSSEQKSNNSFTKTIHHLTPTTYGILNDDPDDWEEDDDDDDDDNNNNDNDENIIGQIAVYGERKRKRTIDDTIEVYEEVLSEKAFLNKRRRTNSQKRDQNDDNIAADNNREINIHEIMKNNLITSYDVSTLYLNKIKEIDIDLYFLNNFINNFNITNIPIILQCCEILSLVKNNFVHVSSPEELNQIIRFKEYINERQISKYGYQIDKKYCLTSNISELLNQSEIYDITSNSDAINFIIASKSIKIKNKFSNVTKNLIFHYV